MFRGFKRFLMQGNLVTVAVGLVIALAFSTLIQAFTTYVINPLVAAAGGGKAVGLGWQLGAKGNEATYLDIGSFISAVIYFIIFIAVVYFVIVVPYRTYQARRGVEVFGEPAATKTCPACLSADLPAAASKCKYCATDQPAADEAAS